VKRISDLTFSLIMVIILFIVLLLIGLIIKLSSKGPVIFKQRRIGKDKKEFSILKFRTMKIDAPKDAPTHLLENPDKYITPIGKFLRKTSLDELPQLFNVIKGEMSFIGPRPALYNQYDLISLRDKYGVNKVRPGITGWAQVNGRDELPIPEKVEYDRYYVENMSFLLEIQILIKTFINIVMVKGVVEGKQELNKDKKKKSIG
jgi:O-antigen biosynthesis protein WbqP